MRFPARAVLALVLVFGGACGGERTFYDSLDLDSPTAAVETFTEAFSKSDYPTVWLTLDRDAQQSLIGAINLLQYREVFDADAISDIRSAIDSAFDIGRWETFDQWYVFDRIMLMAERHDAFLVDLRGGVTISESTEDVGEATVTATVDGIEGEVEFRLTLSPVGKWRVRQVVVPGGDESRIPWSAPPRD